MAQEVHDLIDRNYTAKIAPGVSVVVKSPGATKYYAKGLANLEDATAIDSLTTFRMASVSKQFTAMAIYQLIAAGKIDFQTPVRSILPELPAATKDISVANFLNHSSGILDYENLIEAARKTQLTDFDVLEYIRSVDSLYFPPGSQFRYSNTAYCLLALIVERLTHKSYPDAIEDLIFKPLGIKGATVFPSVDISKRAFGYHPTDNNFLFADQSLTSSTKGDGGVYISAVDYNRWLDNRNPLFTPAYWNTLQKHKILVKDNIYYSLGWFVNYDTDGSCTVFHSGESTGFHNMVVFAPNTNKMISIFSNRDDFQIARLFDELASPNNAINALPRPLFHWLNQVYMNE